MGRFEVDRTVTKSNKLEHPQKTRKQSRKPYEIRGMIEVDRTRTNCDTEFLVGPFDNRTEENEKSGSLRCPARLGRMGRFEVDRTVTKSNKLEHPQKTQKQSRKPYELRGMIEVEQTRTNFDTKFCDNGKLAVGKRRF